MKRLGSLILAACMALTMAGCRSRIDPDTEKVIREAVEDDLVHEVLPVYALMPETTIKRIKMQHDTDFTVTGTYELNDELFQTIYTGKFELTGYIDDGEVEIVSREIGTASKNLIMTPSHLKDEYMISLAKKYIDEGYTIDSAEEYYTSRRTIKFTVYNSEKMYVVETFENEKDLQTALSNNKITERHLRGKFGPDDPVYVLEEDCSTIVNDTTLILEYTLKAE